MINIKSVTPVLGTALAAAPGAIFGYPDTTQLYTLGSASAALLTNLLKKQTVVVDVATREVVAVPFDSSGLEAAIGNILDDSGDYETFTPVAGTSGTYGKTSQYTIHGYEYADTSALTGGGVAGISDVLPMIKPSVSVASLLNKLEAADVARVIVIDQTAGTVLVGATAPSDAHMTVLKALAGALSLTLPYTPTGGLPDVPFE